MTVEDVRYRLLGPMEVPSTTRPCRCPAPPTRPARPAAPHPGRTLPATLLFDRLWAESTLPVDPMNALQIRVSKLRRNLKGNGAPDLVTREGVGYRADVDPTAVDAVDFADRIRAARAAAADTGPTMEAFRPRAP